jgi:FG-GAP-like repeat
MPRRAVAVGISTGLLLAACGGGGGTGTAPVTGGGGQATTTTGGTSAGSGTVSGTGGQVVMSGGTGGTTTATAGGGGMPATGGDLSGGGSATAGSGGTTTVKPPPTCTDAVLRTGPPAGKENLKTDPIDQKFPFSTHWMGRFSDDPTAVGITGMADFDNDGDLDFASGQRGGPMKWWEYCSPDHWALHAVGSGHNSPGGGNALDVDNDGWVDMIAGDSWYKNPQNPRMSTNWERHGVGVAGAEDIAVGDINGDGKQDAVWVWDQIDPQWRTPGADVTKPWPLGAAFQNRQTQGGFIGDIDGDGDNDVLVGKQYWYRNADGKGTQWETVNFPNQFDDSPLTTIGDIDGDGDMDFAMCTHFGARVAWFENMDGKGATMTMHVIGNGKNKLHAIFALDFDNDGDLDIYSGESTGTAWIWENTDGKGAFTEHAVSKTSRGHDARVGDVDCDGDLDIVGKPWGEGEPEPRDTIYLKNELVEKGGKAVFTRPKGEVWHPTQTRKYCP